MSMICNVDGCENTVHAKGYCTRHYGRFRRYGDANVYQFEKHGLSDTLANNRWRNMRRRCLHTSSQDYADYGGRGITICDRWKNSFEAFYEDMGEPPTPNHSLERRNVDGNYGPENCYWADASTQASNQRKRARNTSGYIGAYRIRDRWQSRVSWQGTEHYLGTFRTREEAAAWRDAYIIANDWPHRLNFMENKA